MQRTSHAIIITGAMIVFFMHKRLNLMAILDNWLMPPFILMTLRTVPCLTLFDYLNSTALPPEVTHFLVASPVSLRSAVLPAFRALRRLL